MAAHIITAERLRELLHYNPDTGIFTWRVGRRGKARKGSVAGCPTGYGYLTIRVDWVMYQAHRLAWIYMTGSMPQWTIDHKDGDRVNNRFANLRDVPSRVNNENVRAPYKTKSERQHMLGVQPVALSGKWVSRIRVNGREHYLGAFRYEWAAHLAYLFAKRRLHEGCTI